MLIIIVVAQTFVLRLILYLDIAHVSNVILTFGPVFNLISLFLNHIFHINHCLFGHNHLLLDLKFFIVKSGGIGEHALSIFHLIDELAMICTCSGASSFALSFLIKIIALGAHGVVSTSCFVSPGARIESWVLSSV